MKPEQILDPDNMPEELQWVTEHYRLQPNDPVFLLIAWHWKTVQGGESKLSAVSMELQAALTARAKVMIEAADSIAKVGGQLTKVQAALDAKPVALAKQLEAELTTPVAVAVATVVAAERALARSVEVVEKAQRRQALASFLIGAIFGGSLLAWLLP